MINDSCTQREGCAIAYPYEEGQLLCIVDRDGQKAEEDLIVAKICDHLIQPSITLGFHCYCACAFATLFIIKEAPGRRKSAYIYLESRMPKRKEGIENIPIGRLIKVSDF